MKKWLLAGTLVFLGATGSWAEPMRKLMVLTTEGKPSKVTRSGKGSDVLRGQMWEAGDWVKIPAGSTVTVLTLSKGERQKLQGPLEVKVEASRLSLSGAGKSESLRSVEHKLALSGENHRQVGGAAIRGSAPQNSDGLLDRVEYLPGKSVVVLSGPRGKGPAPVALAQFYDHFVKSNISVGRTLLRGEMASPFVAREVAAQAGGDRWVYRIELPALEPGQTYGLMLLDERSKEEILYTRIHHLESKDWQALEEAKSNTEAWAQREPQSPEPWLVYACVLEEKGQLWEALQALDKALQFAPQDPGLLHLKGGLLLDLGQYAEASQILEKLR